MGGSLWTASMSSSEKEKTSPAHHAERTPSCRKERSGVKQLSVRKQDGTGLLGGSVGI